MKIKKKLMASKIRPIVLQDCEVRAILEEDKKHIRRPIKRLLRLGKITQFGESAMLGYDWCFREKTGLWLDITTRRLLELSPYGRPGDRLWVRETWRTTDYKTGNEVIRYVEYKAYWCNTTKFLCSFETRHPFRVLDENKKRWRSPITMPRWASRLTLEVTDIKIDQGQSMWAIYFKVLKQGGEK